MKILRTVDIQYLQLSVGIKTGNAAYPCPTCNWRLTGVNSDAVDIVCSPRNVQQDLQTFHNLGSNRKHSQLCHGQQGEPSFIGDPVEGFVPTTLHKI